MSEEVLVALIAALGGGGLTAFVTAFFNRRKTSADTAKTIAAATHEIIGDYRERNNELDKEVFDLKKSFRELRDTLEETQKTLTERDKQYRQEQALQDIAIENMNAKVLKLELLNIIYVRQMRSFGIDPIIEPSRIETISVDDLRDIAQGMSNIEERRNKAVTKRLRRDND